MTDTASEILAELDQLERRRNVLMDRLRALVGARSRIDERRVAGSAADRQRTEWVRAALAFQERGFAFDAWMIRRICQNHPEWACLLPGGWHVDRPRFQEFADLVERGEGKFKTAKLIPKGP